MSEPSEVTLADATTDAAVLQPNLALVLERITDGFFALDADWRIAYMNPEARRLLRVEGDPIGEVWLEAFPKARGRRFEREYVRAMRQQTPVQFVEYSATAECWFEVKAYPSSDGLSVYFRDVSNRIEAQRELEHNARRQRAIIDFGRAALGGLSYEQLVEDALDVVRDVMEAATVDVYRYDPVAETFTVTASAGWAAGTAFDPKRPPLEHLRHVVRFGEAFVCADLAKDPRAAELAGLRANGAAGLIGALIGTPYQPIGALVVATAQPRNFPVGDVRFVESIAQTVAEAARSHEAYQRMRQVIESIRDAFVSFDRNLRITYVNARMARFWGHTPGEMIGMPLQELARVAGAAAESVMAALRATIEQERPRTFESRFDGSWYEFRVYPFSEGVAAYVRDITKRKEEQQRIIDLNQELERRVEERTKQLELANKELESFSYSVSHDLRAPLRAIDGFSQALVEDYNDQLDGRARNYLDRVRKAAQRMADLIDALLGLARVARTAIVYRNVNLSEIAASFAEELRERDPSRTIEFTIQPDIVVKAEPHLMRAALENLLGNAWKFTRNVGVARIAFGRTSEGEIFVRDNGAGFDMTYAGKLFGAFARLHAVEEFEGTGIGLATVARVIHRHGGTIRAEGCIGSGATFTFTLPEHPDGAAL